MDHQEQTRTGALELQVTLFQLQNPEGLLANVGFLVFDLMIFCVLIFRLIQEILEYIF